ncbi:MAG TPA: VanZ family protein [Planctomycetota bacterium]|nr:VanZ family protein [Phycisphaerae bacterium]HUW58047.1 VanZ family protein [Planctomycetota bacterium]
MGRSSRRLLCIVTFAYVLGLIVLSILPSGKGVLGGWDQDISPTLQNALHVPAYALLVLLVTVTTSRTPTIGYGRILVIAVLCTAFATILESAQAYIPGRTASVTDAALNVIGVLVGAGLAIGWRGIVQRTQTSAAGESTE